MSDLATVQQLAERVSQMGYPPLPYNLVFLSDVHLNQLSRLEATVLGDFLTACFNARHELCYVMAGYSQLEIDAAREEAYQEGKAVGLSRGKMRQTLHTTVDTRMA